MIGWIVGIFKTAAGLASYFGVGAGVALAARFLPIGWGMVVGGAAVVVMHLFVWSTDDSALKAQNAALVAKQAELVLTTKALRTTLAQLRIASEANDKVLGDLKAKLAAMPDKPKCVIDKSIVDDLNRIQ